MRLYLYNWDRLRVFAALDTVALHLTGQHGLAGIGLPLFLTLSVALSVGRAPLLPLSSFTRRRVQRVVFPWLFWSLLLIPMRVFSAWYAGQPLWDWAVWPMVLYGPYIHLWFLPYIVMLGLLGWWVARATVHARSSIVIVSLFILSCAFMLLPPRVQWLWPFDQWFFSLPALGFGLLLGRLVAMTSSLRELRLSVSWLALGTLGVFAGIAYLDPPSVSYLKRFGGGVLLLCAALWLPNVPDRFSKACIPLLLGAYVLHLFVYLWITQPIGRRLGLDALLWARVAIGFVATLGLVALLRRTPLKRWL